MSAAEPRISRTKPTWTWKYEWRHRGRIDIHGARYNEVRARHSGNEEPDPHGRPNEIAISHKSGESQEETIYMSRAAATQLIAQLEAALGWEGE